LSFFEIERSENDGGVRFVVSHPFHDETVEWMGHPAAEIGLKLGENAEKHPAGAKAQH
jgi:hypothetical protein